MKKLLVFLVTFFVILTLPFTTISCSINQKNNTKYLINWFDNTHPNDKVKSVLLNLNFNKLYMFPGIYIDKVIYQNSNYVSTENYDSNNLVADNYNYDFVIYSYQNHKFYDCNNIEDNIYGLIAWLYSQNNDIFTSILNYENLNYNITSVIIDSKTQFPKNDFNVYISFNNSPTIHYYAKWITNSVIPTFKLDQITIKLTK